MVLVEPRKHFTKIPKSSSLEKVVCRASKHGKNTEKIEPAVDLPIQFNFGSLYSSSLTIFFDF